MRRAMELARVAGDAGEVPIGAVLVDEETGEVVAEAANACERDGDPTAQLVAVASVTAVALLAIALFVQFAVARPAATQRSISTVFSSTPCAATGAPDADRG